MLTIYYFQITTLLKKHINWYWKTKFKAFIVSHCKQPSLYTNIAKYFNELFKKWQLGLEKMHLLPCLVTIDSCSGSFQYKILDNVLCLNKKLFAFRKSTSSLSPFCKLSDETVLNLFYKSGIIQNLWMNLIYSSKMTSFYLI